MKGSQGRDLGQEPGGWHGAAGRGRVVLTALFSMFAQPAVLYRPETADHHNGLRKRATD